MTSLIFCVSHKEAQKAQTDLFVFFVPFCGDPSELLGGAFEQLSNALLIVALYDPLSDH